MSTLSRRHLVTTAAALPALAMPAAVLPAAALPTVAAVPAIDSREAMVIRAQQMVDLLGTCYVREGWKLDVERAAQFVESVRTFDENRGECPKFSVVLDWMHDHGQSFDWLVDGDPTGLITARAAQRATVGDAELLRLGVELEALIVDWQAQQAIDRKEWADVDAALEAAGLPDIERGSLPDDEYRAYRLKRAAATDSIFHDWHDRRGLNENGVSIAWRDIHDRQFPLIDAIMGHKAQTLAGFAVQARAVTLSHSELWESPAEFEGDHHRPLMEAACAFAGVVPVPLDAEAVQ
jgi:hypothetical protein